MTIVPIKKGDAPIPPCVIWRSREAIMKARGWPQEDRDDVTMLLMANPTSPKAQAATDALTQFRADLIETIKINEFNHQLAAYRKAAARLSRHILSEGQSLLTEQQGTGIIDPETGDEVMEEVVIRPEIEPIPAEIEQTSYDEDGNEVTEVIANPVVVRDLQERAAAQSVIDTVPQEVKDFDA